MHVDENFKVKNIKFEIVRYVLCQYANDKSDNIGVQVTYLASLRRRHAFLIKFVYLRSLAIPLIRDKYAGAQFTLHTLEIVPWYSCILYGIPGDTCLRARTGCTTCSTHCVQLLLYHGTILLACTNSIHCAPLRPIL